MRHAQRVSTSDAKKAREKELENRRLRGQISCAECRRLKLKCDKKVPCSSCIRRGCQTICPNGALSAGHGTRFVLAGSDKLHRKVLDMSSRIRQLEDALQIAHAAISSRDHPLLAAELLKIKNGVDIPDEEEEIEERQDDDELDNEVMSSFDTLAISDRGEARFFGRTGSEAYLTNEPSPQLEPRPPRLSIGLPTQLTDISRGFPFTSLDISPQDILKLIETHLPSYERASALCEAYLENLSWFFRPVDREQIMEELIPSMYKKRHQNFDAAEELDFHELAALLMVFSVGAVADLTLEPYNDEAEKYYHLSRAAISLKPIFDGSSFAGVQAVALMGAYDLFACRKPSLEGSWNMLNLAMLLAASIGIREPDFHQGSITVEIRTKSNTTEKEVVLGALLYRQLEGMQDSCQWFVVLLGAEKSDRAQGIGSGRPTIFNRRIVDCEYPADSAIPFDDDTAIPTFWSWKHRFISEVVSDIADKLGSARAMKYSEILELDRRVREFGPPRIYERSTSDVEIEGATLYLQRTMMCLLREIALLSIHRIFFARAMLEDPDNYPMRSRFAPSFLSAYRSAVTLLKVIREDFQAVSHLMLRFWPVWAHALTASVILGSVAARGRYSSLAPQAFVEFDQAISFFQEWQPHPVVKSGLPILHRLREKAHHALYQYHADAGRRFGIPPPPGRLSNVVTRKTSRDELVVLGGSMSRLLDGSWEEPPVLSTTRIPRQTAQPLTISLPSPSASASPQRRRNLVAGAAASVIPSLPATEQTTSPASTLSDLGYLAQSTISHSTSSVTEQVAGAANASSAMQRRPSGSVSPSSSASDPGGSAAAALLAGSDWANTLSMDALGDMATHAEWSTLMGLGGNTSRKSTNESMFLGELYQSQVHTSSQTSGAHTDSHASATASSMNRVGLAPSMFSTEELSTMPSSSAMNVDFDISADMRTGVFDESLLPLQMDDDATVAEAWRTFFQDPRFFNHDAFDMPM